MQEDHYLREYILTGLINQGYKKFGKAVSGTRNYRTSKNVRNEILLKTGFDFDEREVNNSLLKVKGENKKL